MPIGTLASVRATTAGTGIRTIGVSTHGSPSKSRWVRSARTTRSRTEKWWLPLPQSPETVHVSSMATSDGSNTAMRSCGSPLVVPMQLP